MRNNVLVRVVAPLAAVTVISLVAHSVWSADGFFLNLSTEFIGIMVTVCYVDWIVSRHEKQRWKGFDARIADRLRATLNATIRSIGTPLGVTSHDLGLEDLPADVDVLDIHKKLVWHADVVLSGSLLPRLLRLDQAGWKNLYSEVQHANETVRNFQSTFRDRLTPEQNSDLLDLEERLASGMTAYFVFPDIMGCPKEKLPPSTTPGVVIQQSWSSTSARSLRLAIASIKSLSDSIPDESTVTPRP